uniref:Uncharacterized protein n=1 Tax=Oncorhynchus tshawytscha TaxID=74940 RepID=A0A8C8JFA2_ONCTS
MFHLSPIIILFPKSTWPYLPFWKQFVAVWDHLFKAAAEQVLQKMEEIEQKVHLGQPVEGEYLTHLLVSEQMSVTEILGSIAELLLAGIDTVRHPTPSRGLCTTWPWSQRSRRSCTRK